MAKPKPNNTPAPPHPGAAGNTAVIDNATGEIIAEKAALPVLSSTLKSVTLPNGVVITLQKQVNIPVLRHPVGSTVFFTVTGKHYTGKAIEATKMAAAELVPCVDLLTGQERVYIVSAVLLGLWGDEYANSTYVGKSFAVYKGEKGAGKRYSDISVQEIGVSAPKA